MTLRINFVTTSDLDLAAYYSLRGCRLEGVEATDSGKYWMFCFTGSDIPELTNEYHSSQVIEFSPKAFMATRRSLKQFCRASHDKTAFTRHYNPKPFHDSLESPTNEEEEPNEASKVRV